MALYFGFLPRLHLQYKDVEVIDLVVTSASSRNLGSFMTF